MPADDANIIDNPSLRTLLETLAGLEHIAALLPFLETVGLDKTQVADVMYQLPRLWEQSHMLTLPDRFNAHFAKVGWIAYESFNLNTMRQAIALADAGYFEEAERLLTEHYHADTLRWSLRRMQGIEPFRPREALAACAQDDYLAGRYHACVPVLLTLIDGLVNDIVQTGFFADRTDLTAWDSIAAHSSGLQSIAKTYNANRTKTTVEPITVPYRNGILHGRDLGYANQIVAAKCWATFFAVGDWARAITEGKKNPPPAQPEPSVLDNLQAWFETQHLGRRMDAWSTREPSIGASVAATGSPGEYEDGTPEQAFAAFLQYWEQNNYGKMAAIIVDYFNRPINTRAGEIRRDFAHITPKAFTILAINDTAPAMVTITALVTYREKDEERTAEVTAHLLYADDEHTAMLRGAPQGQWRIHQRSFIPIISPKG